MVEFHDDLCKLLSKEGLPCVDYRVSADYGSVIMMESSDSATIDIIGPPVNMCSKINREAKPNCAVIGGDLYSMVKNFEEYNLKGIKGFSLGFKYPYPVYELARR